MLVVAFDDVRMSGNIGCENEHLGLLRGVWYKLGGREIAGLFILTI